MPEETESEHNDTRPPSPRPTPAMASQNRSLISPSKYLGASPGESLSGVRRSPLATERQQLEVRPTLRRRRVDPKVDRQCRSGCSTWEEKGYTTKQFLRAKCYRRSERRGDSWFDVAAESDNDDQDPNAHVSHRGISVDQSEKDQRTWSALKTSLLHGSEMQVAPRVVGVSVEDEGRGSTLVDPGHNFGREDARTSFGAQSFAFAGGTRCMEQLDFERSAMDRTARPNRVASARLLDNTTQESPTRNNVSPYVVIDVGFHPLLLCARFRNLPNFSS